MVANIGVGRRKWVVTLFVLFVIAQCVFAVTGIRSTSTIGGDDRAKSGSYSNLKGSMHFSLKDRYSLRRSSMLLKTGQESNMQQSMVTYKKGNITYIIPYKSKSSIKLPGFLRTSPMPSGR